MAGIKTKIVIRMLLDKVEFTIVNQRVKDERVNRCKVAIKIHLVLAMT